MGEISIRVKFPLVEPEIIEAPTEKEKTVAQLNAPLVAMFEKITNSSVPENCRKCKSFASCSVKVILNPRR